MRFLSIVWSLCLAVTLAHVVLAQTSRSAEPSEAHIVPSCLVMPVEEALVPAREPGVLNALEVREGLRVKAGQLLAQIDDDKPQQQKKLAELERDAAKITAESDIDKRLAEKAVDLTDVEVKQAEAARKNIKASITLYELRRRIFSWDRSVLQVEQAQRDHKVAEISAAVAEQKVSVADNEILRRRVVAPFAGVIVKTFPHVGEWVSPGESIVRLVGMDRLRVEGYVKADDFSSSELYGRPVTIEVQLERGRVERFTSKIGYVSPDVEANGEFRVWAEVDNRASQGGYYLVRPGETATMTLSTETAAVVAPRQQ